MIGGRTKRGPVGPERGTQSSFRVSHAEDKEKVGVAASLVLRCQLGLIITQGFFVVGAVWLKGALTMIENAPGQTFNPIIYALAREASAGPILFCLSYGLTGAAWPGQDAWSMLALGVCLFISQLMYIKGIELSGVVVATCMQPAIPVFTALLGVSIGTELPSMKKSLGIFLAVLGAVCMVLGGLEESKIKEASNMLLGNVCLLLNTMAMACYYVLGGKAATKRHSPISVAAWAYLSAAFLMAIAAAAFTTELDWQIPQLLWAPLIYWIFVCSIAGYVLVTWAMRHLPASQVASFQCLQPLLGMLLAFIYLGEEPRWYDLGAIGILGGLLLVSSSNKKEREIAEVLAKIRRLIRKNRTFSSKDNLLLPE